MRRRFNVLLCDGVCPRSNLNKFFRLKMCSISRMNSDPSRRKDPTHFIFDDQSVFMSGNLYQQQRNICDFNDIYSDDDEDVIEEVKDEEV